MQDSSELLRSEVSHYLILAETLKERYGELDDETLRDTLEGIRDTQSPLIYPTTSRPRSGATALRSAPG
jgi:hypothetical protein